MDEEGGAMIVKGYGSLSDKGAEENASDADPDISIPENATLH